MRRRDFLRVSGSALAAAAFFGTPPAQAVGASSTVLSSTGRRTYTALVEAIGTAPNSPVDAARAQEAADAFAASFAKQPQDVRDGVEFVLNAVTDGISLDDLTAKPKRDRAAFIAQRARQRGRLSNADIERSNLVLRAIELAAAPFATETIRDPAIIFLTWSYN